MYSKPRFSSTRARFCPTRPKPQMITCSRRASSRVAAVSSATSVGSTVRRRRMKSAMRPL